ncbi:MAG: SDR family oxidoreductase [Sphaerochaetaceae bacterium]|nr:SDR family oxidoreductase [Sphaerochaetaceae bacterium]
MRILITGSSSGIGRETALLFLKNGHTVVGIDKKGSSIEHALYTHETIDITSCDLPELPSFDIVVACAGVQDSKDDIDVNLKGTINVVEGYAIHPNIKAILIVASASAHSGAEFAYYSASKGGLLSYTRNVALRVAKFGAVCNSISPGGVKTELNRPVMEDKELWNEIMKVTPLKKWAEAEEIAQWIYFLTVVNRSCTGEDILIDNGEMHLNATFVWPNK